MKVTVIGAGFVGLTTACVLANRGIDTSIHDLDTHKIEIIFSGSVPFFEPGLEELLQSVLSAGTLKRHAWESGSDLVIICVGTPSLPDGSIDISQVQLAVKECATHLPKGSLVAIKSTVVPGTTRNLQNLVSQDLELLMIPEFLREGSAVSDALTPDRNVIGAERKTSAEKAVKILGLSHLDCIITSTFSAECIKYLSNAFLATCISFTNEVFNSFNKDSDFEADKIISGWHLDRRFRQNESGKVSLTSYLIPGPGFGGSCFPKDVRALRAHLRSTSMESRIIDAVINTNKSTTVENAKWIDQRIPKGLPFLILGLGFKDDTDDTRESPSVALAYELAKLTRTGFWYDPHIDTSEDIEIIKRASTEQLYRTQFFILMHHSSYYRELLEDIQKNTKTGSAINVFALRYQPPIDDMNWIYPKNENLGVN
jgi:UDPglucose 6-dehydrogenase